MSFARFTAAHARHKHNKTRFILRSWVTSRNTGLSSTKSISSITRVMRVTQAMTTRAFDLFPCHRLYRNNVATKKTARGRRRSRTAQVYTNKPQSKETTEAKKPCRKRAAAATLVVATGDYGDLDGLRTDSQHKGIHNCTCLATLLRELLRLSISFPPCQGLLVYRGALGATKNGVGSGHSRCELCTEDTQSRVKRAEGDECRRCGRQVLGSN